jgi:hypothetical protein
MLDTLVLKLVQHVRNSNNGKREERFDQVLLHFDKFHLGHVPYCLLPVFQGRTCLYC